MDSEALHVFSPFSSLVGIRLKVGGNLKYGVGGELRPYDFEGGLCLRKTLRVTHLAPG